LEQRRKDNESLNDDSPLFRERYQLGEVKLKPVSTRSFQSILIRAKTNAALKGEKKNGRYSEQLAHGFRKRFNTILKLNNEVNDNAIEKMMGHKHGLDGVYFQGTNEQLFDEFRKGIIDLTVDDSERLQAENIKLHEEKTELETANETLHKYKIQMDNLEKEIKSRKHTEQNVEKILKHLNL